MIEQQTLWAMKDIAKALERIAVSLESIDKRGGLVDAFKAQHGLTDAELADPVNQTLFAIQYPEAKS